VRAATLDELRTAHAKQSVVRLRDARPDLPTAFVRVVDRAIARDPEKRYTSAGELESDLVEALEQKSTTTVVQTSGHGLLPPRYSRSLLYALAAAAIVLGIVTSPSWMPFWRRGPSLDPREIRSIAVLPLTNLSGDPSQEYFADGMTDALIDQLAKLKALRVISRTSAMQFKGTKKSLRDVARLLNVDAVLEGSVVKSGDRVRISADLVHVATERHIWVDSFDRDLSDLLALQADVAQRIAREIQIQLTPQEQAGFGFVRPVNTSAEEAYLQGRFHWNKRSDEAYQKALDYFRQAAAIDPSFALAYAGQADVYNLLPGSMSPFTAYPLAKQAANHALSLDPTLAEAHTSLAFASFIFDRDWSAAETEFKQALRYNSGYATAHHWYGEFLSVMGRLDEALAQLQDARARDPLSAGIRTSLASTLYVARRYDDAITEFRNSLEIDPASPTTYYQLALAYLRKGLIGEADAVIRQGMDRAGVVLPLRIVAAASAALKSDRAGALDDLNQLGQDPQIDRYGDMMAYAYSCLGDRDRAFEFLARAERAGAPSLLYAKVEPIFDGMRDDPRYDDLLRRLRLVP
jgi:TolB-like protein